MRVLLVPAALAAGLATATMAMAAPQQITGSVRTYDQKAQTVTLDNGIVYKLPSGFKDPRMKAGDKVQLSWEMKNGQHAVDHVTIVR